MNINFDILKQTLPILAKGMTGIFIVTVIIILCVAMLNRLFSEK